MIFLNKKNCIAVKIHITASIFLSIHKTIVVIHRWRDSPFELFRPDFIWFSLVWISWQIFLQSKVVSLAFNPQPGGPGSCIYVPQWQGDPVLPPNTWFPFYDSQGYSGSILTCLHIGNLYLQIYKILILVQFSLVAWRQGIIEFWWGNSLVKSRR
jgi:hypothetical protein